MADPLRPAPVSGMGGVELLRLARQHRDAAVERLRGLEPEVQARLCLEVRPEVRGEFLLLVDDPERVVPHFPDAEFAITARASGMSDAAFLLETGTAVQAQAAVDLDCWRADVLEVQRLWEWLDALVEAGPETVGRLFGTTDLEVWIVALRGVTDVAVLGKEDDKPEGWFTVDGVVYWGVADDFEGGRIEPLVSALFDRSQSDYWSLVYGLLFESVPECEEWALRWRRGRLADLGFPERDQAMRIYRPLEPEDVTIWEAAGEASALVEPQLLPRQLQGTLLGEALGQLPPARAAEVLGYVLGVANSVAVADRLCLSDSDAIPGALEKAVRGIDRGLRELSLRRSRPAEDVLDATAPKDLFRIGATHDPTLQPPLPEPEEPEDDD